MLLFLNKIGSFLLDMVTPKNVRAAVSTGVQAILADRRASRAEDLQAEQFARADRKELLELELAALKARFSGGGGAQGPIAGKSIPGALTDFEHQTVLQGQSDTKIESLNNLIKALQGPLARR